MSEPKEGSTRPRRIVIGILLLGVLSCFLRLWPIGHGAPQPEYVPDTHIVRNALQMLGERDLVPPAGKYSSYPYLLPYVLLPVYAGDYALGRLRGDWKDGEEYGTILKEYPWHAHILARVMLALLAASAPIFVLLAARAAGMTTGAWIAAILAATSLLHVQLSLQERPWGPVTAAIAATAWAAAVHVRSGTRRSLLLTGVAAAIAGSIHQAGLPALGIAGLAWALAPVHDAGGESLGWSFAGVKRRVIGGVLCVAAFTVIALVIGHPYILVHGLTESHQVAAQDQVLPGQIQITFGAQQIILGFRLETLTGLTRSFLGYDPVLLILGLGGLVLALRRRALLPAMIFLIGWAAFFMTNVNEHIRYLLPMAMLMTLPAGLLLERLAKNAVGAVVVVLILILPLVQALRLGYVLRQPDTRAIAAEMLVELPPDARVAIDMYGPIVPQTLAALEQTAALRELCGSELYGREAHRRAMLEAGQPQAPGIDALRLEDVFEYDPRHGGTWIREPLVESLGSKTAEVLGALGVTHILLVDRTPDDGVLPPLTDPTPSRPLEARPDDGPVPKLAPLELPAGNVWTVHPSWSDPTSSVDGTAVDAHLPTALAFPLRDLWSVRRPGPKLQLFELPTSAPR